VDGHEHRMLLVEDHAGTRTLLRRMLALCLPGWEIDEAATLAEGLARLDPPPECLVLDLGLPDGGVEMILRKVRDERLPTRVVVHTGMEDPSRLGAVAGLGPNALFKKPLDSEALNAICGRGGGATHAVSR
jgi:DNA-binding NarL/FixJ family response regulator